MTAISGYELEKTAFNFGWAIAVESVKIRFVGVELP